MANLHKTERKLPWLVRDGGLCSDWLGGRARGGIICSHIVKLLWHARHSNTQPLPCKQGCSHLPLVVVSRQKSAYSMLNTVNVLSVHRQCCLYREYIKGIKNVVCSLKFYFKYKFPINHGNLYSN